MAYPTSFLARIEHSLGQCGHSNVCSGDNARDGAANLQATDATELLQSERDADARLCVDPTRTAIRNVKTSALQCGKNLGDCLARTHCAYRLMHLSQTPLSGLGVLKIE